MQQQAPQGSLQSQLESASVVKTGFLLFVKPHVQ